MRTHFALPIALFITLFTSVLLTAPISAAFAADPHAPEAPAAKPASTKPSTAATAASAHGTPPASAKANDHASAPAAHAAPAAPAAPAVSPAVLKGREEIAEVDLSAKIAARLAALRAQQAAKAANSAHVHRTSHKKSAAAAPQPPAHGEHWSYEGELGPRNWGKINAEWIKCSSGSRQSPIDIRDGMKVDLEQVNFDYRPSGFNVVDNGHTVQVGISGGNFITIMGRTYELMQFHFHRPSEERINGRGFEMVVHLVHKDSEGKLAVVAVLIERGKAQPLIQTIWNNLPLEKFETNSPSTVIDVNDILPNRRDYFTYMGSLTTPPCSEGVLWMVMKEPVQASGAQLALFSRLYPMNARPIQANAGRVIKESN